MIEHLLSMCETMSSIPNTTKKKKSEKILCPLHYSLHSQKITTTTTIIIYIVPGKLGHFLLNMNAYCTEITKEAIPL